MHVVGEFGGGALPRLDIGRCCSALCGTSRDGLLVDTIGVPDGLSVGMSTMFQQVKGVAPRSAPRTGVLGRSVPTCAVRTGLLSVPL